MRTTIILFLLCLLTLDIHAYAGDDEKISCFPIISGDGIPDQAKKSLEAKMEQAISKNGFGSNTRADRFVMFAKCNIIEKDVAPTTPPRIMQTVEVTFIIGDVIENTTYASASFELKGIGTNETKAWQTAFSKLKADNPGLVSMFESASEKIESYYSANCKKIMSEARTFAATGDYDRAIYLLMSVPDVCGNCRYEALGEVTAIYQQKIDAEGAILLARANNAWAMSPGAEGAEDAMSYLCAISPISAAFGKAEELAAVIGDKVSSDKGREWKQRLKEYNDEKELRRREQSNRHVRSIATIAACRSVAEKLAERQPQIKIDLSC